MDNRAVHFLSDFAGKSPTTLIKRYDRKLHVYKQVECPGVVKEYIKFMGGIVIFDSFIALYRTKMHCTRRYYLKIFVHFLNASIVNAWLQYHQDYKIMGFAKKDILTPWDLKASVAKWEAILDSRDRIYTEKKRGNVVNFPSSSVRRDGIDHLPLSIDKRAMCKNPKCKSQVKTVQNVKYICVFLKSDAFMIFIPIE